MELAIYGGSFNPPHLGHREALVSAMKELKPDRMMVIPDHEPPHKEMAPGSPSTEQRLRLCRLNFSDLEGVEVSDMEVRRSGKSYTYDTVRELEETLPEGSVLTLLLGTDMFLSFEEWYHFDYLLHHCVLAVLAREEDDRDLLLHTAERFIEAYGARVRLLPHEPLPMHSAEIREMLPKRSGTDLLYPPVYAEIIRQRFYGAQPELSWLREQAYGMLDEKRIAHVAGCESEAVRLSQCWGEDPEVCAEAGILHDITKRLSYEEQLKLCEKYGMMCDIAELERPKLLHARTGAALARDRFGVTDAVYEAIRWHTTGKPDMNLLEKIVYLADYIEPTRDFPGIDELRRLAYEDLDAAVLLGLQMTVREIRECGQEPYIDTLEACTWYEARINERRDN